MKRLFKLRLFSLGSRGLDISPSNVEDAPSPLPNPARLTNIKRKDAVSRVPPDFRPSFPKKFNLGTPEADKKKVFRRTLSQILSCMYAVFIIAFGVVIYLTDLVISPNNIADIFGIYLSFISLIWLIFLHADIRYMVTRHPKKISESRTKDTEFSVESMGSQFDTYRRVSRVSLSYPYNIPVSPSSMTSEQDSESKPGYCFLTGRHAGNFYLKIGAAGFCLGHLIHEGLLLSRDIIFLLSDDEKCADYVDIVLRVIHPLSVFYQLFIMFKYSHVIVNRHKIAARFGFMHNIAASLCYWFATILQETLHSYHEKTHPEGELSSGAEFAYDIGEHSLHLQNHTHEDIYSRCLAKTEFSNLIAKASPYLYPFSIEFNFLMAGTWFILWQNIGRIAETCGFCHCSEQHASKATSLVSTSRNIITVDCHAANRGLFAGFFVLVLTVISLIIFFLAESNDHYVQLAILLSRVSQATLLTLMTVSVLLAYHQLTKLDLNLHAISILDDLLLFIAVPSFFMYGIFSVVALLAYQSYFAVVVGILQVVQVVIQTPFIIDGLRRCSNTSILQKTKPGRGLVTFLIICNLALWIIETFEIKSTDDHSNKTEFYGKLLWTLLSHMTLPLCLFYRFHSTVCLVDIWKCAYEPEH